MCSDVSGEPLRRVPHAIGNPRPFIWTVLHILGVQETIEVRTRQNLSKTGPSNTSEEIVGSIPIRGSAVTNAASLGPLDNIRTFERWVAGRFAARRAGWPETHKMAQTQENHRNSLVHEANLSAAFSKGLKWTQVSLRGSQTQSCGYKSKNQSACHSVFRSGEREGADASHGGFWAVITVSTRPTPTAPKRLSCLGVHSSHTSPRQYRAQGLVEKPDERPHVDDAARNFTPSAGVRHEPQQHAQDPALNPPQSPPVSLR